MNDPTQMMNRPFGMWQPPQPIQNADDPMLFQTPRPMIPPNPARINWRGKKNADRRKKAAAAAAAASSGASIAGAGGCSGYQPPSLNDLQIQNRIKARRFYAKKKFTRFAPLAPRNTTSFIIRAKKSGGIASLVSPCPVTPAILPTPKFSPSREGLVDMAKEEWGVDGYGSMKGLIRLRSGSGSGSGIGGEDDDEDDDGSSESDVEEHLEVERRLDHDLSRFEMVHPNFTEGYILENRVDDQDNHIAKLEEENLTLKERVFLIEREMRELRRRLEFLETESRARDGINAININNDNNNDDNNHDNEDEQSYSGNNKSNNINNANGNANEGVSENDGVGDVCSEKSVGDCDGVPMSEE